LNSCGVLWGFGKKQTLQSFEFLWGRKKTIRANREERLALFNRPF